MNIVLWVLQGLLAISFAMAGRVHAFTSREVLAKKYPWVSATPPWCPKVIGAAELLGAVGLILPMALAIVPRLSAAAAAGLALLMGSATVLHIRRKEHQIGVVTFVIMLLAVFIVIGRLALAPA